MCNLYLNGICVQNKEDHLIDLNVMHMLIEFLITNVKL